MKLFQNLKKSVFILLMVLLMLFAGTLSYRGAAAGLADYTAEKDTAYNWLLEDIIEREDGSSAYLIRLTSQQWQGYIFEHRLVLIIPEVIRTADLAGLYIGGGSLAGEDEIDWQQESEEMELLARAAVKTGSPMAIIFDVPYQPLFDNLREDALISYTFDMFLETQNPEWPLLLPMTATVVRAMDCLSELAENYFGLTELEFLIFGGSKRGWTAWLTAAVDSRVAGIAPAAYDNLGLKKQMEHQLKAWGEYSPQISDYTARGLQEEMDTIVGQILVELVDPYEYLEEIAIPKLIITGTNDPYWPLDALHLYYDALQGPVNLLYIPNAGHGLDDWERILAAYGVFHYQTARGLKLPAVEDTLEQQEDSHFFTVFTGFMPAEEIRLWQAESAMRDFREADWMIAETRKNIGSTEFEIEQPEEGWTAFLAEVVFSDPHEFSLTTRVHLLSGNQP